MSAGGRTMADSAEQKEREIKEWDRDRKAQAGGFAQESKDKAGGWPMKTGPGNDGNTTESRETESKGIGEKMGDAYEKTKETIGSMFGQSEK